MDKKYQIHTLNDLQIRKVYKDWMKQDFPVSERKPLSMIMRQLQQGSYECLGLFDSGELVGYAFLVKDGGDYLLDYFAIARERRDQGLGSIFLARLSLRLAAADSVIIETENPDFAEDESARDLQTRRLQFYLRNGCRETDASARVFGVEYRLLELPVSGRHSAQETHAVYENLYLRFLPGTIYRRQIRLHA